MPDAVALLSYILPIRAIFGFVFVHGTDVILRVSMSLVAPFARSEFKFELCKKRRKKKERKGKCRKETNKVNSLSSRNA